MLKRHNRLHAQQLYLLTGTPVITFRQQMTSVECICIERLNIFSQLEACWRTDSEVTAKSSRCQHVSYLTNMLTYPLCAYMRLHTALFKALDAALDAAVIHVRDHNVFMKSSGDVYGCVSLRRFHVVLLYSLMNYFCYIDLCSYCF